MQIHTMEEKHALLAQIDTGGHLQLHKLAFLTMRTCMRGDKAFLVQSRFQVIHGHNDGFQAVGQGCRGGLKLFWCQ